MRLRRLFFCFGGILRFHAFKSLLDPTKIPQKASREPFARTPQKKIRGSKPRCPPTHKRDVAAELLTTKTGGCFWMSLSRALPLQARHPSQQGLYHTVLCYAMLCYTILYHTKLCYAMRCLYYTIPYYTIPYYTIPYYTILYYTIPYSTILYYTISYYTILYF